MSDGKIRVKSKSSYSIEVNDNGDCICFDLSDIGLQAKLVECYDSIIKESSKYSKKEKELINTINEERKEKTTELYTKSEKDYIKLQQDFYAKCRSIMDKFLGDNACQKIFGDSNYPTMYLELFEQLEPHFKKMGLSRRKMQQDLYEKYLKNDKKVLE